jgi:DNA invertase Pin-like site-specific DNA recombinase
MRKKPEYHQAYGYKRSPEGPLHSMPSKTIAYLRVSTGGQDLDQQKLAILDYARRHRMPVADFVEVHGAAGSRAQREQLLGLLDTLQPGDRLIVSELSRLGRSLAQILQIVERLMHKNIRLVALKESIRFEGKHNVQTKAMIALFGLFAEVERDLIAERTKEGLAAAKAKGTRLGRPKGALGKSKLDGKEAEIALLLQKKVSKASLARIVEVSPMTLDHFIRTRKLQPSKPHLG